MVLRKLAASALVAATTLASSPAAFAGGYGGGHHHSRPSLLQIVLALPYCIVFGCHSKGHHGY